MFLTGKTKSDSFVLEIHDSGFGARIKGELILIPFSEVRGYRVLKNGYEIVGIELLVRKGPTHKFTELVNVEGCIETFSKYLEPVT